MTSLSNMIYYLSRLSSEHDEKPSEVAVPSVGVLLVVTTVGLLALFGLTALLTRREGEPAHAARLRADAEKLAARAREARTRAVRAVAQSARAWDEAVRAERARQAAWQALEAADRAYETAQREALAETDSDEGANEECRRLVAQAALSAYRRGDISAQQFREVWRGADQQDLVRRAREIAVRRCQAERVAARQTYDRATEQARRLTEAARIAGTVARALTDEAAECAAQSERTSLVVERQLRRPTGYRSRHRPC